MTVRWTVRAATDRRAKRREGVKKRLSIVFPERDRIEERGSRGESSPVAHTPKTDHHLMVCFSMTFALNKSSL